MNIELDIKNLLHELEFTNSQIELLNNYKEFGGKQFYKLYDDKYKIFINENLVFRSRDIFMNSLINSSFSQKQKDIIKKYYEYGFGLKLISRELKITYTKIRQIFKIFNIDIRRGTNIITNPLRKFRSEKALNEDKLNIGWHSPNVVKKELTGIRGIQGYYYNKNFDKYIWLRSTYEYIYAIWLDYHKIIWDVEVQTFNLQDGTKYRPDFFIYENDINIKIIEIKGWYDNRAYKLNFLKEQLKTENIEICMLFNTNKTIEQYLIKHVSYSEALNEWKKNRILKKPNNEKN